jgi:hypothetical protein
MLMFKQFGIAGLLTVAGLTAIGCSSAGGDSLDIAQSAVSGPKCNQVQAKDPLIAQLVADSWREQYPLTRLYVASGIVTGTDLTPAVSGDLDIINTVPDALASVIAALDKVSGLPDYGFDSMGPGVEACTGVPAWSTPEPVLIDTERYVVTTNGVNDKSWKTAHKEFGKECPLIKVNGANQEEIDPPGDGTTSDPQYYMNTAGVTANAFGLCPSGTTTGTYCRMSYATGSYYLGRWCKPYYGQMRCVLY